jgi:hypothetical protein
VFSRSDDEGVTWSEPMLIAGCVEVDRSKMASWAFPMVSRSGRIYVLYNRGLGFGDYDTETPYQDCTPQFGWNYVTGLMEGIYSDDNGQTWSPHQQIVMPKSPLDNPDPNMPSGWIVWQKPERLSAGKYFVGFTRWVSPAVRTPKHNNSVHSEESVCEFMRFENIDDDPEPRDIQITYTAWNEKALRVPYYNNPNMSASQEPSIVKLPDGRLFVAMRTMAGCIWYSLSEDEGLNWCNPRPLLHRDFGRPILHPLSPCPIYQLTDGRYVLFHHNNDGRVEGLPNPEFGEVARNRRPVYLLLGEFRPDAEQPLWFSQPKLFMDNLRENNQVLSSTLSLYSSFTNRNGNDILWYPESKVFLLGKKITPDFLRNLTVPK